MFSLAYGLFQQITDRPVRRVILVGEESSGKSTYLEAAKSVYLGAERLESDKITPTVGLNVAKLTVCSTAVLLWDLGGRKSLRPIWERYLDQAQGMIFVIDSTDLDRLADCKQTLKVLLARPALANRPLLVYVNKQDIETPERISLLHVSSMVQSLLGMNDDRPLLVLPCSAIGDLGVREGLDWMVNRISMQMRDGSS